MHYLLTHLAGAASVFVAIVLAGDVLQLALLRRVDLGPLRAVASWVLGLAFWMVSLFALAAAGLLGHRAIIGLVLVCVAARLALWVRGRQGGPVDDSASGAADHRRASLGTWVLGLVLAAMAAGMLLPVLLLAIGPTVSWDADVYHLTLPRIFLEAGGFETVPTLVYQHWPLGTELLYAMAMAVAGYPTAKVVHFGFGLVLLMLLGRAVARRGALRVGSVGAMALGFAAVALVLANDVFVFEMRVAYVELLQALLLLAAVLLMHRATRVERPLPLVALASVACGLVAGTKVTGLMWSLPVALVYLPRLLRATPRLRHGMRAAASFGVPLALLWLPWPIKTWLATGDPLYPLLWSHLGGPWWDAEIAAGFTAWQRSIGMGRELVDYLLLPLRVVLEGGQGYERFDGSLTPVWLVAVPLAALGAWRDRLARAALLVTVVGFALWAASSQQMRFLVPLLPLLALAAALGAADLAARLQRRMQPIVLATLAVSLLVVAATAHARIVRAGFGRLPIYLEQPAEALYARAKPPAFTAIDRLPSDATVLMIDTNRGFFCHRPYVADSFFEASQIRTWLTSMGDDRTSIAAGLTDAGITHVLAGTRPSGIRWPRGFAALLAQSRLVHQDAQHRLFALPVVDAESHPSPQPSPLEGRGSQGELKGPGELDGQGVLKGPGELDGQGVNGSPIRPPSPRRGEGRGEGDGQ